MHPRYLRIFVLLLAGICFSTTSALAKDNPGRSIRIQNAWSIPTFAGSKVGVGYFDVINFGKEDDVLLSVESTAAGKVELHENVMDGDMMQMKKLERITIPAGKTIAFAPGRMHLMLMMLKKPLALGDTFNVTLTFEKAGDIATTLKVVDKQRLAK